MANIRVDVNYTIKDGSEIVFRSPVDCSAITGLIVYYPAENENTTSKEFALADAHGNNVGDVDHLFAENVVVKVILDVTSGMAFVQNADTNAYLEQRFESIEKRIDNLPQGGGGGVSSWNDLTDKPFGEEGDKTYLLEEQLFNGFAVGGMGVPQADIDFSEGNAFVLVAGETYTVIWDEVAYTATAQDASAMGEGVVAIGNLSALGNEPFAIGWTKYGASLFVMDGDISDSHKVGIYQGGTVTKTLDAKYLPMEAIDARIEEYISKALEGEY